MLIILTATALTVGCGDTTGVEPDDLAGTWVATSWIFANPADASQTVDLLAAGGAMSIEFKADGSYMAAVTAPGETMEVDTGTYSVTGNVITIAESGSGSPADYTISRDGDLLTLTGLEDEEVDWDEDGQDDPATMTLVLERT